jgi:colicin import membrane protein
MNDRKIPAAFLAILVHLILLAVLIVGFRWQVSEPVALQAQIWRDLPPIETRRAPETKPTPKPVPRPVPKPEPVSPPKPVPVPRPDVVNPDIALKKAREEKKHEAALKAARLRDQKLEKEKQLEKQRELEKQKEDKLKAIEKQKQIKAEQERKLKAMQEQKAQQKLKDQADALARKMQAREAAARASLIGQYTAKIKSKIRRYVVVPPDMQGNPEAEFEVVLLPDGEVFSAVLRKSSGNAVYDAAVERAILRASPLPLPPDPSLFGDFRDLDLHFRPNE